MDLAKPYSSVFQGVSGDVLEVLSGSSRPFTGREVARLAHASQATTQRCLDRFVEHGLVESTEAGRARLYLLNRDHLAAPGVEALTGLRAELIARLKGSLGGWAIKPTHASLFGSAARGDGQTSSDIDILLIRPGEVDADLPGWRDQVAGLAGDVERWTGNPLSVTELTEADLRTLKDEHAPFIDELKADAINLSGPSLRSLLRNG